MPPDHQVNGGFVFNRLQQGDQLLAPVLLLGVHLRGGPAQRGSQQVGVAAVDTDLTELIDPFQLAPGGAAGGQLSHPAVEPGQPAGS